MTDISAAEKMFNKSNFIDTAQKYLKIFFDTFNVEVNRMSYIEEKVLNTFDSTNNEVRNKYLNEKYVYNSEKVFEWSSNSVSVEDWDINEKVESVNLNVTIALRKLRTLKEGQPVLVDALVLTQDLNTKAEETMYRFSYFDIECFLKEAIGKSEEILLSLGD